MDIRCEKCSTTYEFDEAQISEAGATVQCTHCGHLFKVARRRDATREIAMRSGAPGLGAVVRSTRPGVPPPPEVQAIRSAMRDAAGAGTGARDQTGRADVPEARAAALAATVPPPGGAERAAEPAPPQDALAEPELSEEARPWLIRSRATGDVHRFDDFTVLHRWIVERRVARNDELSRSGESWRILDSIPELVPFFAVVDQADSRVRLAVPVEGGQAGALALGNTARLSGAEASALAGSAGPEGSAADGGGEAGLDGLSLVVPRRRVGRWLLVGLLSLIAAGAAALVVLRPALVAGLLHRSSEAELARYRAARELFLSDTDDGFLRAAQALEGLRTAGTAEARVLALLAEVDATRAAYLRDDARALDQGGQDTPSEASRQAAQALRKTAQGLLDQARVLGQDALGLDPEGLESNRAMADFLRIDGAPTVEVSRYLRRAQARGAEDPETVFVAGALALRDGRKDEARTELGRALDLAARPGASAGGLLRARLLLARLLAAEGQHDAARKELEGLVASSPGHARARALLASIGSGAGAGAGAGAGRPGSEPVYFGPEPPPTVAVAPLDAGTAPAVDAAPVAAAAPLDAGATAPRTEETDGKAASPTEVGGAEAYDKLVLQGDRLAENGRSREAQRLYQRALQVHPEGVEALTGLGYCALDGEKYGAAVDLFAKALAIAPSYGEAMIGMAEAYRTRGETARAVQWYRRYLVALPAGPKAALAQKAIRDLDLSAPATGGAGSPGAQPTSPTMADSPSTPPERPAPSPPPEPSPSPAAPPPPASPPSETPPEEVPLPRLPDPPP